MIKLLTAVAWTALLLAACGMASTIVQRSRPQDSPAAKTDTVLVGTLIGLSFVLLRGYYPTSAETRSTE